MSAEPVDYELNSVHADDDDREEPDYAAIEGIPPDLHETDGEETPSANGQEPSSDADLEPAAASDFSGEPRPAVDIAREHLAKVGATLALGNTIPALQGLLHERFGELSEDEIDELMALHLELVRAAESAGTGGNRHGAAAAETDFSDEPAGATSPIEETDFSDEPVPSAHTAAPDSHPGQENFFEREIAEAEARRIAEPEQQASQDATLHVLDDARPEPADVDRYDLNDLGAAERFVAAHGARLRYVHPWQRWLVYDGAHWRPDDSGEPERLHKELLHDVQAAAVNVRDEKRRNAILRYALASGSAGHVRSVLELARSEAGIPVQPDELDADPFALNVANGTLDLRKGELRPHDRADLITKLAAVVYDPGATAPRFTEFLDRIFAGDADTIAFVGRYVGYSLTGSTAEQKLAILWGTGQNGKSTLLATLRALLGDYGQQAPAETFLERRGDGIPNDLARMRGARMVVAAEVGEGRRLNEALVKQMTGGEPITARFMRGEYFEFVPAFTPWLATNHKPEIRGVDLAIWRRVRLVPFTVTIPEDERDNALAAKLRAELPGILNWALAGCLAWQRDGLGSSAAIDAATADYRDESDILGGFITDCCVTGDGIKAKAGDLYARYGYWATANGVEAVKQQAFGRRLADRGYPEHRTRTARWRLGIGIRDDQEGDG